MSAKSEIVPTASSGETRASLRKAFSDIFRRLRKGGSSLASICTIFFVAFLFVWPAHATDPVDVDPDPDTQTVTTPIVVEDLSQVDPLTMPPGHYVILVVVEDGPDEIYELFVP